MSKIIEYSARIISKLPFGDKIIIGLKSAIVRYTAHNIAFGFAIGMFFGILPTFGVGGIFAIIFAQIFKASKIAALIGTFFTNPLTSPFFLSLSILIGSLFTGIQYNPDLFLTSLGTLDLQTIFLKFLLGNIIVAVLCSLISYLLVYYIATKYAKRKFKTNLEHMKMEIEME